MKTSELTGPALDWAVAQCEGLELVTTAAVPTIIEYKEGCGRNADYSQYIKWKPSTDWAQGGLIIEREKIKLIHESSEIYRENAWWATDDTDYVDPMVCYYGPTPLIAAMRCLVASRLGDEVEIPEELLT